MKRHGWGREGVATGKAGAEKGGFFPLFIQLWLCHFHFPEAGGGSAATDSLARKFLTATVGWIWNGAFCSLQVQQERVGSLLKKEKNNTAEK